MFVECLEKKESCAAEEKVTQVLQAAEHRRQTVYDRVEDCNFKHVLFSSLIKS